MKVDSSLSVDKYRNIFSKTLNYILETGEGYRNENYGGAGVYKIKDIIEYEILELNNKDIIYTLNKFNYAKIFNKGKILNLKQSRVVYTINNIFYIISNYFQTDISDLYGLWLTDEENVKQIYCYNSSSNEFYNKYNIQDIRILTISDLGNEGCLFITTKHPKELIIESLNC